MNKAGKRYLEWLKNNKESQTFKEFLFWIQGGNRITKNGKFYNNSVNLATFAELFFIDDSERKAFMEWR